MPIKDHNEMLFRLLSLLALCFVLSRPALAEPAGAAKIIDGDTLTVTGHTVDLFAIAAPSADQICQEWVRQKQRSYRCGAHARAFLASLVSNHQVECVTEQQATGSGRGNVVATCYANGQDIALAMVQAGWALAARQQSDRYVVWENNARTAKAGLWGGSFTPPAKTQP